MEVISGDDVYIKPRILEWVEQWSGYRIHEDRDKGYWVLQVSAEGMHLPQDSCLFRPGHFGVVCDGVTDENGKFNGIERNFSPIIENKLIPDTFYDTRTLVGGNIDDFANPGAIAAHCAAAAFRELADLATIYKKKDEFDLELPLLIAARTRELIGETISKTIKTRPELLEQLVVDTTNFRGVKKFEQACYTSTLAGFIKQGEEVIFVCIGDAVIEVETIDGIETMTNETVEGKTTAVGLGVDVPVTEQSGFNKYDPSEAIVKRIPIKEIKRIEISTDGYERVKKYNGKKTGSDLMKITDDVSVISVEEPEKFFV